MNLVNIAKQLLHLAQMKFDFEDSTITADEIFASQQLFQLLKTFKDSFFNELNTYQTLDFHDEENIDDYDENQSLDIRNNFTLEEMQEIVEWVDQHPNYKLASIKRRFRKVKRFPNTIPP